MASRSKQTILVITRDLVTRADFRAGGWVRDVGLWQQARPAVEDFPSLVEAALRLGPKRVGRVWVLSSEIWTQTISLPIETVAGLAGDELNRSLAFEAEPLSGIGAFDSHVAHVELPGEGDQRRFWLTQILASHLDQIEYIVEQAGGRLAGVGHPSGLPRPMTPAAARAGTWRRVELWPDAVIYLYAATGHPLVVHVLNTDPKGDRWRADVDRRLGAVPASAAQETLCGTAAVAIAEMDAEQVVNLCDQLQLEEWLRAWAEQLSESVSETPLVRPPKRPLSTGRRRAMAILLGLLALLFCVGHYLLIQKERQTAMAKTEKLLEPKTQLDALNKQFEEQAEKRQALQEQVDTRRNDLRRCEAVLYAQRQRFARLLRVLAEHGGDGLLVRKIDGSGDEVAVNGVCLRPELANGLAVALDKAVGSLGWEVEPPDKEAQSLRVDGSPWTFEIRLHERPRWHPLQSDQAAVVAEYGPMTRER